MKKRNYLFMMMFLSVIAIAFSNCSSDNSTTPEVYDPQKDPSVNPNLGAFLADSNDQLRVAMIEDFTGVRCQYCPNGHEVAKSIYNANPGKVVVVAVHGGLYGDASAGWPNFTTPYGGPLRTQAKIGGYPAGTISRISAAAMSLTPQVQYGYAVDRGQWDAGVKFVIAQAAPVNIGAKAWYSASTKKLSVKVDLYCTKDQPGYVNINVALLQDKLTGKQYVYPQTDPVLNYEQNNVLRDLITGQWGEEIYTSGITKGTKVRRVYTYTVPSDYNGTSADGGGAVVLSNLKVVVFVSNGHLNILNAKAVAIQ
jgi:hypothetical protein